MAAWTSGIAPVNGLVPAGRDVEETPPVLVVPGDPGELPGGGRITSALPVVDPVTAPLPNLPADATGLAIAACFAVSAASGDVVGELETGPVAGGVVPPDFGGAATFAIYAISVIFSTRQ
jgi:hypothetical protein